MEDKKTPEVKIEVTDGAAIPTHRDQGLFTAWRIAFFWVYCTYNRSVHI